MLHKFFYILHNYLNILANVRDIGLQLFGEVEDLEDYLIPFGKTAVPVKFIGHPSLSDGKVCTIWSDFEKFVGRYLLGM